VSKTLIDGDIIAYRCSFSKKGEPPKTLGQALRDVDDLVEYTLTECSFYNTSKNYTLYLTGGSGNGGGNYRDDIAVTAVYKGNRPKEKPELLPYVRQHLEEAFETEVSYGEEADDLIAMEATKIGPHVVVASADKDMLQIPAYHFNFNNGVWKTVDYWQGLQFFYTQILTGDTADNIKGLFRVGPKKAEKILKGAQTEDDLWDRVLEAYDGDLDRVVENARLLWLRRYQGELWEPPHQRKLKED
jgi:hypothetical protein